MIMCDKVKTALMRHEALKRAIPCFGPSRARLPIFSQMPQSLVLQGDGGYFALIDKPGVGTALELTIRQWNVRVPPSSWRMSNCCRRSRWRSQKYPAALQSLGVTIDFTLAFIVSGIGMLLWTGSSRPTALIPTIFGGQFCVTGRFDLHEHFSQRTMHAVPLITQPGFLGVPVSLFHRGGRQPWPRPFWWPSMQGSSASHQETLPP